jgi:hypothetical protein
VLTLNNLDKPVVKSPMPDVAEDLMSAERQGYFKGMEVDRLLATLEMLRHQELTVEHAAILLGMPRKTLIAVLSGLPIDDFRRLAQSEMF